MINEVPINEDEMERDVMDSFLNDLRSYPCLYNKGSKEYHLQNFRQNALEELSRNLHEDVAVTEKRLKKCLALYSAEKNHQDKENRSGSGVSIRKKWEFFDLMHSFMKDVKVDRETRSNFVSKSVLPAATHSTPKKSSNSNKNFDPLFHSYSKFDAVLAKVTGVTNNLMTSKTEEYVDEETLVGTIMEFKLNKLSPKSAKKKTSRIFRLLPDPPSSGSESN